MGESGFPSHVSVIIIVIASSALSIALDIEQRKVEDKHGRYKIRLRRLLSWHRNENDDLMLAFETIGVRNDGFPISGQSGPEKQ